MKANIWIMSIIAVFFFGSSAVYTLMHMASYDGTVEWAGTIALALSGILAAFIAFYLVLVGRGLGGVLPEDRSDAHIDDGDPEQGHFSPWSWWPVVLGAAISLVFLGVAGPTFLFPIGVALTFIMLVGWVYEYYRGNFTR